MFCKFFITAFFVLVSMMVCQDLQAMNKKEASLIEASKKNKPKQKAARQYSETTNKKKEETLLAGMNKDTAPEKDDSCEAACVVIPAVLCGTCMMQVYRMNIENTCDFSATHMEDECLSSVATTNLWGYGMAAGFGGAALGKVGYAFYKWCLPSKEKQQ